MSFLPHPARRWMLTCDKLELNDEVDAFRPIVESMLVVGHGMVLGCKTELTEHLYTVK